MKNVAFTAVVLCSLWIGCSRKETSGGNLWRPLEPRLTTATQYGDCHREMWTAGRIVRQECDQERERSTAQCPDVINDAAAAERTLIDQPHCTAEVITAHERLARVDPRRWADVAAAYYVQAQRENSPGDLLAALEAADEALAADGKSAAARFNQALALQELGLYEQAAQSWDAFLRLEPDGPWSAEASAHRTRIAALRPEIPAAIWNENLERLPAALQRRNAGEVRALINPFPKTALLYFENHYLTEVASSPTAQKIAEARFFAAILSDRHGGDRMPVEAVEAIARAASAPEKRTALEKGHALYTRFIQAPPSQQDFPAVVRYLELGQSPMAAVARVRAIGAAATDRPHQELERELVDLLRYAESRRYHSLTGRIYSTRAFQLWGASTYPASMSDYEEAGRAFSAAGDRQSFYDNLARAAGVLRLSGGTERAFEQLLETVRFPALFDLRERNVALMEAAFAAVAAGRPRAALHYQNAAVEWVAGHAGSVTAAQRDNWEHNLAAALRGRAEIKFKLGQHPSGLADLENAIVLTKIEKTARGLRARLKEVEAQSLLPSSPERAVTALTEAMKFAEDEPRSSQALLFAQRAGAYRRLGKTSEAEKDLQRALKIVREEEANLLRLRQKGEWEGLWSAYFSRFRTIYDDLVLQLVQKNDKAQAFAYVERSRAYEPLNLIARHDNTPAELEQIAGRDLVAVADIQRHLPPDTFLLEYAVLEDRTLLWIVGRDHFELLPLNTPRERVERWSDEVQRAIRREDHARLNERLIPPYAELVAPALEKIGELRAGRTGTRLVIVPDRPMRGIPWIATADPRTGKRLIEHAPISFAGSATLFIHSVLRSNALWSSAPRSILLIGDPASKHAETLGLGRLPAAISEVGKIGAFYKGRATTITRGNATREAFRERAPHHDIIHFAGHSAVHEEPFRSALLLATTPEDDGVLEARELLDLPLHHTSLFVMSSCKSADNLPVGPEGVAPLVRPLIAAGVPAVIGSLWDVADATTEPLLVSMYDEYRRSGDAAASLQKAQLTMLRHKNPVQRSVLVWGAFQVIGHTAPPHHASTTKEKEIPP